MRHLSRSRASGPQSGTPANDFGASFQRVLVPIYRLTSANEALALGIRIAQATPLRLIHIRIWDRLPRGGGRLYFETSVEATVALDEALSRVWACGVPASGTVVDAERAKIAGAIVTEASQWGADAIILTELPRLFSLGLAHKVARQVLRTATCPVLVVQPKT